MASFYHILNEVLGRNDTSNLKRGLVAEGVADIFDLSSLDDEFIDDLEYPDIRIRSHFIMYKRTYEAF
jgi:hypothetical protein